MSALSGDLSSHLWDWLPRQRWFPAKGRPIEDVRVVSSVPLVAGDPAADFVVLEVAFSDGGSPERYQLVVGQRQVLPSDLEHVSIGRIGDTIAYDGLWDHEISRWLLDALARADRREELRFVPEPGAGIPSGLTGRVLDAEQSNTSVVYGEQCILKLFRRVVAGVNPDLELHRALRAAGSTHVAALRASIEAEMDGESVTLGMLQDFAANSADGWAMALISVRDLYAEADLHADEVGGDFAADAFRLGQAVAAVHADLARVLESAKRDPGEVAAAMDARLVAAEIAVPALAQHAAAIHTAYEELARQPEPIVTQRIHGDLHLGQTLRTPAGWLLIDFEGEPVKALTERARPDSVLRDIAGMLRSFDYAAYHRLSDWEHVPESDTQLTQRAGEWSERNQSAFCDGYTAACGTDPRENPVLLRAYELDKAVYEAVYEERNRPSWLPIPLASIARLVTSS